LGWKGPLVREDPLTQVVCRGTQEALASATKAGALKRDGREVTASPACGSSGHEEVKAQEGQTDQ